MPWGGGGGLDYRVGVEHPLRKRSRRQQQTKPNYQLLGTAGLLESVARTQSKIGSHMIPKFMTKATKSGTDQWQWNLNHERKPNLCSPEKSEIFLLLVWNHHTY